MIYFILSIIAAVMGLFIALILLLFLQLLLFEAYVYQRHDKGRQCAITALDRLAPDHGLNFE